MRRRLACATVLAALTVLLAGCEPAPRCVEWQTRDKTAAELVEDAAMNGYLMGSALLGAAITQPTVRECVRYQ